LLALRAWLRSGAGDADGATEDLRRAWDIAGESIPQVLRCQWRELQELIWDALDSGALEPRAAVSAIERGWPGGEALVPFMTHPLPAVRRLAIASAAASGHPDALAWLPELERDADPEVATAARTTAGRLRREPPALAFGVLGGFTLRRASRQVPETAFGRPIAARSLRFMLVHRGVLLPEDALFEAFWPDKPPEAARRNLAVVLSLIRRVVDPPGAQRSLIETSERAYRLRLRERDTVDSDAFERAADAALEATGRTARPLLERAERLWTGEPLPEDHFAQWSASWREELVDRYLQVLGALARDYGAAAHHPEAIRAARKCVQIDPLNETWQRELIAAYARAGRTSHALRQYLECRRTLVDALGVEPSDETARLQAQILAGHAV
jgi:DNA-binding SARP family transcriptional activator